MCSGSGTSKSVEARHNSCNASLTVWLGSNRSCHTHLRCCKGQINMRLTGTDFREAVCCGAPFCKFDCQSQPATRVSGCYKCESQPAKRASTYHKCQNRLAPWGARCFKCWDSAAPISPDSQDWQTGGSYWIDYQTKATNCKTGVEIPYPRAWLDEQVWFDCEPVK